MNEVRQLPQSIEAEEYLLLCCMLDGRETVQRCREAGIKSDDFYDTRNGIVWACIERCSDRGLTPDVAVVAEELKASRQLDGVGGYAFLTQVSSRVPTTAQASHFIEIVREQSIRREIIRSAACVVDDCCNYSGGIEGLSSRVKSRMDAALSENGTGKAIEEWSERRAGFGRILKDEEPTLRLNGVPIFNRGNLGLITAVQKTGKSAAGGAILAALLRGQGEVGDTFGFTANNDRKHAVIHFDTEQSPKDHEALIETAKKRVGAAEVPPWLYSYGVKGVSAEQLRRKLHQFLRETRRIHGGVFLVLLDGVADLVADPNDARECNPFVAELESHATEFNCSLVCVLHLNPSPAKQPTKSRGHLGSQLERKCETDLRLVKDADEVTTIFTACARHAPILEKDGPRFSWDSAAGMHVSVAGTKRDSREADERSALIELALDVYEKVPSRRMRYTDLTIAIKKAADCEERTAQKKVSRMKKLGVIHYVPPRLYEIVS